MFGCFPKNRHRIKLNDSRKKKSLWARMKEKFSRGNRKGSLDNPLLDFSFDFDGMDMTDATIINNDFDLHDSL